MANRHIKQLSLDCNTVFKIELSHHESNTVSLGNADEIRTDFEAQVSTLGKHVKIYLAKVSLYPSGVCRMNEIFMTLEGDEVSALRDLLKLMDHNLKLKAQT